MTVQTAPNRRVRGDRNRMVRRYPFDPIERLMRARAFDVVNVKARRGPRHGSEPPPATAVADVLGVSRHCVERWREIGVDRWEADDLALAVGSHPAVVWPEWLEPAEDTGDDAACLADRWAGLVVSEAAALLGRSTHWIYERLADGTLPTVPGSSPKRIPVAALEGLRDNRTHCAHGHAFTAENTYVRPTGWRTCQTCQRERERRSRARRARVADVA